MKHIYEDETLPSGSGIPDFSKPAAKTPEPVRPRPQVSLPPKQQERKLQQELQQQMQQQMPQPAYQYIPVNPPYPPPQGAAYYPLDPNAQQGYPQGVYPQQPYPPQGMYPPQGYGYMPYAPYQQMPQPQPTEAPSGDYNPGTRVLFQSPDFDSKEGSVSPEVGVSFAGTIKAPESSEQTEAPAEEKNNAPQVEEVSLDSRVRRRPAPEIETVELRRPKAKAPSEDISFSAFTAANAGLDIEEMEQQLPPPKPPEAQKEKAVGKAAKKQDNKKKNPLASLTAEKKEIIRRVILGLSVAAIVISAGMLINEYRLSRENDKVNEEVEELIITESTTKKKDKDKDKDKTTTKPLTPEEQWAQIKEDYPDVLFPSNIQLKYAKLYGENQDFVGYLSADGVNLNLPVVQTDNDEVYLNKNFYGAKTKYGCPFVTHLNNVVNLDLNTVIFGHHMNNGTIFGALDKYKSISGFKAAPVITFNTLYKDYKWKVIAAFITNDNIKDDNGYVFQYYFTSLSSQQNFSAYLNELAQRSLYDTGVDVLPTDKLLTLSTCSHEFEDARFVVVARLVREGESATVDTSKATVNSNPRYPQAYYNAKKIKNNPYKNANHWVPG